MGAPDPSLTGTRSLLAQLFHDRSSEPMPRAPVIRLENGAAVVVDDVMSGATALAPKEFAVDGFTLPPSVLSFYSRQAGQTKVDQRLRWFSRDVLELRIETAALFYDPFAFGAAGV